MNTRDPFIRALTGDDSAQTVTLQRQYRASVAELWNALTTPDRIARWYGTIIGPVPRAVGDEFRVDIGGGMIRRAVLERCEAPNALVYTWWSGDDDPGLVQLQLESLGDDETSLRVQHDRLRPHRMIGYGGGWEHNLVALADAVGATREPEVSGDVRGQRWELLRAHPLEVELSIDAPLARVWAAWSSADGLAAWWWRHWDDVAIEADVRPGGSYLIEAPSHGITVSGEYLVVDPERRLAFTWLWTDGDDPIRDEAVDVTFRATGGATSVVVRHTGPWDTDAPAESYRQGWEFVLTELARRMSDPAAVRRTGGVRETRGTY